MGRRLFVVWSEDENGDWFTVGAPVSEREALRSVRELGETNLTLALPVGASPQDIEGGRVNAYGAPIPSSERPLL